MRWTKYFLRLMALLVVLLASTGAYYLTRPLPIPSLPMQFSITPGGSLKSAAHQMQQAGVLSGESAFIWLTRLLGQSTQIKAGNYQLETPVTLWELTNIVSKGQVTQSEISIIEGWTFKQFRAALNAHLAVRHDSRTLTEKEILQHIGISEEQAEGLFFPDTYYFSSGTSDLTLLKRAYQTMQQHLQQSWETRAPGLPLKSPYQALILASIVEKETGLKADRNLIASVFINRLRKGMMLQTDPTVIYGLGDRFDGNLRRRDLLTDTPYNTYTRAGLPPTPIALPGLAALQATLHPASGNTLYFVARGDGSSEFSGTLTQHNRAVNRYQK